MPEFIELQRRKGKFYSKCEAILNQAKQMYNKLKPKVDSLSDFETQNQEDKRMQKERDYLTYNHDFDLNNLEIHKNQNYQRDKKTEK